MITQPSANIKLFGMKNFFDEFKTWEYLVNHFRPSATHIPPFKVRSLSERMPQTVRAGAAPGRRLCAASAPGMGCSANLRFQVPRWGYLFWGVNIVRGPWYPR